MILLVVIQFYWCDNACNLQAVQLYYCVLLGHNLSIRQINFLFLILPELTIYAGRRKNNIHPTFFSYEMFMPYAMDTYIAIANIEYASVDLIYRRISD